MESATKKQATLAKFGFTKTIETTRWTSYQVHLEDFVTEKKKAHSGVTCPYCHDDSKLFTSQQYLNNHVAYKHPGNKTIRNMNVKTASQKEKQIVCPTNLGEKEGCVLNLMKQKQADWCLKEAIIYTLFQVKCP